MCEKIKNTQLQPREKQTKKEKHLNRINRDGCKELGDHLYVANSEDNRVRQVDFVGILVDGRCDDRRIDDDGVVGGHGLAAQLHAGVLCGEVDPDVFVEDEGYPDLTCRVTAEGETLRNSIFLKPRGSQTFSCHGPLNSTRFWLLNPVCKPTVIATK